MHGHILIIDDEEALRKLLGRIITLEGFEVEQAGSLHSGWDLLMHKQIDIVLCDVKLSDGNGVDYVKKVKDKFPLVEVILLTAYGNIPDGVQAIKNGAFDYITKGNDNDRIVPLLYQAMNKVTAHKKSAVKVHEQGAYRFSDIIGNSPAIKQAVDLARKIAPSQASVLLLGETGTGKEVFANAIHTGSQRAAHAFVAINCSAFARELLEGELFGHKAGAYTGAVKDKKGLIELAHDGSLFLDEIGDMNIDLQAKLLRVLETGEFIKVGDVKTSRVNVRIIAATNRDLGKMAAEAHFREDLLYRLNVFTIQLPALREHVEDMAMLAGHFLAQYAAKENKQPLQMDAAALQLMQQYSWKGNIRELRNVLQRATILADGHVLLPEHLPYEIQRQNAGVAISLTLASVEKHHIQKVLQHLKGNKTKAAEALGIGLTTLYRKMEEYQLTK